MKSSIALQAQKLNKFVFYVSSIAIALFGILYSFGEVKAETITLLDDSKSSVLWENNYTDANTTKNSASFVATTNNIYSVKALIVSVNQYSSYGDNPFYMRVMDSSDQVVGETSLTWASINQMAGGSDWGWCMANACNTFTEFVFNEPVEITEGNTYYFQIFTPYNVRIGRNSDDLFAFYSYYDIFYTSSPVSSVYWAGVGQQSASSPSNWKVPIYYDFCDGYSSIESVRLSLCIPDEDDSICYDEGFPYKMLKENIGPFQCQGIAYLEGNLHYFNNSSGQTLVPALSINYYDEVFPSEVVKGGEFSYTLYEDSFDSYLLANVDGSINLSLSSTSTPIGFVYDLEAYNWEDEDSFVCLYNLESESIVSETCVSLTSSSGLSSVSLLTPSIDFDQPFILVYVEDDIDIRLSSNSFSVVWGQGRSIWSSYLSSSTSATTSQLYLPIKNILDWGIGVVSKVFPFNVVRFLNDAWFLSANSEALPFSFFKLVDENNNIVVSLPVSVFGSDKTFVLFGPSILGDNQAMIDFFDDIRSLSTYFFYALFFFALYRMSKGIYKEIREY